MRWLAICLLGLCLTHAGPFVARAEAQVAVDLELVIAVDVSLSMDLEEQRLQRHFSYSDRIRYYWPDPRAVAAVDRLMDRLGERDIPQTLISQYLSRLYPSVLAGRVLPRPRDLCLAAVDLALDPYYVAVSGNPA
jgi:tagatose-1,6-bisphosphate aldolase non-catalytic subunit AgaZ/GatZ